MSSQGAPAQGLQHMQDAFPPGGSAKMNTANLIKRSRSFDDAIGAAGTMPPFSSSLAKRTHSSHGLPRVASVDLGSDPGDEPRSPMLEKDSPLASAASHLKAGNISRVTQSVGAHHAHAKLRTIRPAMIPITCKSHFGYDTIN